MSKKFKIISKKDLPDEVVIRGFSFLKEIKDRHDKKKFDFTAVSNNIEVGCSLNKRKSFAFSKGYIKEDKTENKYIEVKTREPFIVILIAVIIAGLLGVKMITGDVSDGNTGNNNKPMFDLTLDSGAEYGDRETKSKEEIQAELNKKVQAGMINISMNLNPVFEDGKSSGKLLIVNEKINHHPQVIEIYRKDTNELIYKSGLIPVGSRVDEGKLLVDLDAGEYDCVAYFNSVDETTGALLGKAGAEICITVNN